MDGGWEGLNNESWPRTDSKIQDARVNKMIRAAKEEEKKQYL